MFNVIEAMSVGQFAKSNTTNMLLPEIGHLRNMNLQWSLNFFYTMPMCLLALTTRHVPTNIPSQTRTISTLLTITEASWQPLSGSKSSKSRPVWPQNKQLQQCHSLPSSMLDQTSVYPRSMFIFWPVWTD